LSPLLIDVEVEGWRNNIKVEWKMTRKKDMGRKMPAFCETRRLDVADVLQPSYCGLVCLCSRRCEGTKSSFRAVTHCQQTAVLLAPLSAP
jgi:hypothetical protein